MGYERTVIICVIALLLLLSLYLIVYYVSNIFLYQPTRRKVWEPPVDYEELYVGNCHVQIFDRFEGNKIVLYCHGNNGNISQREYIYSLCQQQEFNLCLFDYSGYGKSKGSPSQMQILSDGLRVFEEVNKRYDAEDIIVWGESLGTSVGTYIASKKKCFRLILLAPFTSIPDIIYDHKPGPFLGGVATFAFPVLDKYPTKEWIGRVKCPVAVIHSKEDQIIPFENGKKVYDLVKSEKVLIQIRGRHGSPKIAREDLDKILDFCGLCKEKSYRSAGTLKMISMLEICKNLWS